MNTLWIAIVIASFLLAFFVLFLGKKKKTATDYYNLFIMGAMWFIIGLVMQVYVLAIMGLFFFIIGLNYRDKWRKEIKTWKTLSKSDKAKRILELTLVTLLIIAGIIFIIAGQ